ncbi:unnamed protein product, partial [Ixodes hexagonus]
QDRYLFCSGAYDGKVNLYSAQQMELLMCYQITAMGLARNINAVRFTSDGSRILAATTARRLAVIDVERGEQVMTYDNCAFNGRDRASLAADPICPNMAVCSCVNGKGLTLFDLRMPLPLDFVYDVRINMHRNTQFAHCNIYILTAIQNTAKRASCKNTIKQSFSSVDSLGPSQTAHNLNIFRHFLHCYRINGPFSETGLESVLLVGGDAVSGYVPDVGVQERLREHGDHPVWKMRYTSNGGLLYTACDRGVVRRYRRYPDRHEFLGEVYWHKGDIQDMDLSPFDEYLITASKDRSVGVLPLGPPNHGWTEYCELS